MQEQDPGQIYVAAQIDLDQFDHVCPEVAGWLLTTLEKLFHV